MIPTWRRWTSARLRVLYRVEEEAGRVKVIVAIIGKKARNKLVVEGEVFDL
jgi:hypothetical protein